MSSEKLFTPFQLTSSITLQHRVVLAPLTRFRADDAGVHGDLAVEYYGQRASEPGTLLITEGTFIGEKGAALKNVPGVWNDEQVKAWKRVTDEVHSKGSFIYIQLFAMPTSIPSASIINSGIHAPQHLTIPEIREYVQLHALAADNAVNKAGFDGVEIHGANGYLIDQFLQDVSNKRTDEYGGSLEGRLRFGLEVVEAVTKVVGQERVGIRLSPWATFQGMRMNDPKPTFRTLVNHIRTEYPDFGYLHVVEPRITGDHDQELNPSDSNDFLREAWNPPNVSGKKKVYLTAGGYTRQTAIEEAKKDDCLIVFGRSFLANPDLPRRLKEDLPLNEYDRSTFYTAKLAKGYVDYPFATTH